MDKKDFFEFKHFVIDQRHAAMKVGTDCDLLGVLAKGGKRILDIGTGTGVIALMMAQRFPDARITAVEIDDDAVIDAKVNFDNSPWSDRIELVHASFQDYMQMAEEGTFDCIVCNPPYFDKSTEAASLGRTRARHTSSLPFHVLVEGAYRLLAKDGVFSVCIPPEVFGAFTDECLFEGLRLMSTFKIKSIPEKDTKRYILVHKKGRVAERECHTFCMLNSDHSRSDWYIEIMKEFRKSPN